MDKPPGEAVFGLVLLALSLFLLWQAYGIAGFSSLSSPGAFPLAAAAVMVAAALVTVLNNSRRPAITEPGRSRIFRALPPPVVLLFSSIVLAFAVLLEPLGFLPAALAFLLLSIRLLHRRGWLSALLISLAALIIIYVVFRLVFKVVLPEGMVPERAILAWLETVFP